MSLSGPRIYCVCVCVSVGVFQVTPTHTIQFPAPLKDVMTKNKKTKEAKW